jgi:hypothetical protein
MTEDFTKSSYSNANGTCVETALRSDVVLVRDSKDSASPNLGFTPEAWTQFLSSIVS